MTEHGLHNEGQPSRLMFALAALGCFVFLYLRTFLFSGVPFVAHDDQILFFVRAVRVVHGQVPYRDFFELVTPGIDLLYAAGFRVFGVHAWLMQAWSIALGLGLFCVVTQIARRILRGWLVLLPGLLFVVFDFDSALDPTHHWYSTLAAMGAVSVLMSGTTLRRIAVAGLLCGVATLFTQTQGVLAFVAVVIYLVWVGRSEIQDASFLRQLATLAGPFALVLCGVWGYYVYRAGMRTMFFDVVVFPLKFLSSGEVNSPRTYLRQFPAVHSVADGVRLIPFLFIYAVVPYVYFVGLYRMWRRWDVMPVVLRQRLVLMQLVGLALFLSVVNGPRFHRLCMVAPPAILVCVWLLSGSVRRMGWWVLCGLGVGFAVLLAVSRQVQPHVVLHLPIGRTAFSDGQEAREVQWVAERTQPSEFFFNQVTLAMYLALENPTASEFANDDDFTRPEQVDAIVQALHEHAPRFVVLAQEGARAVEAGDHSAPFRRYVHENYHLAEVFPLNRGSRYEEVWERNRSASGLPE
jgi:hypothetical protein